jgi:TonB family protein
MSVSENKNWKSLLFRWLSGAANRQDESQLNQLTTDDPFLAEALEGYRKFPENRHTEDITKLKAKLRGRYAKKERRVFPIWRIAAAAALFVGIIGGFWFVNQNLNESTGIAQQQDIQETESIEIPEEEVQPNSAPVEELVDESSEEKTPNTVTQPTEYKARTSKSTPSSASKSAQSFSKTSVDQDTEPTKENPSEQLSFDKKAEEKIASNDSRTEIIEEAEKLTEADDIEQQIGTEYKPKARKSEPFITGDVEGQREEAPQTLDNLLTGTAPALPEPREIGGKVTDDLGEPLIGANVVIPGTQKGTVTNIDGEFQLNVTGKDTELEISYTGYQPIKVPVDTQASYQIALNNSEQVMDEVTVTSLGQAKRKREKASSFSSQSPYPKGGFDKFQKYIDKNQKYPNTAATDKINGKVILRFSVNLDGTLSNLRVEKSLSKDCDEEAIRLLKEGPKWKTDEPTEMTWTFEFPPK